MNKAVIIPRILRTGIGLILIVFLISIFIVMPCIILDQTPGATPGNAIFGITIILILHLPILFAFWAAILASNRGDRLKNVVYLMSGIGVLILGLMIIDGAVAYAGHINMYWASISMFICVGCDISAAVFMFRTRYLLQKAVDIK